ncbi:immunity protein BlpL [Streptococcus pneumoniae]|nr:immunity protein BlpL [Streptococcus pneumoniae]
MEFRYEKNICNKTQCFLSEVVVRTDTFACFYLSISISSVFQFLLVVINLASILVTVYLTREMRIKEFEDDDLVSPRTNQLMFIGLTGFMSIICLYRGITAGESYQQIIAYIGAILCLTIMLLLIWGLKYYKK